MPKQRLLVSCTLSASLTLAAVLAPLPSAFAKEVWTDSKAADLPKDFQVQGEYEGSIEGGGKVGIQVIALGKGAFQAVVLPGGLPGTGWNGEEKFLMDGTLDNGGVAFKAAEGNRKYLAQSPTEFSAISGPHRNSDKKWTGSWEGDALKGKTHDGKDFTAKKIVRVSPTMGAKPPEGAVVLFDGKNTEKWNGGRADETTGFLNTDGNDVTTKDNFSNYTLHLEFMLPYRPDARGQGRGNSGVYMVDQYEIQVLDTFGLAGKDNECGGIYQKADPKVNMCLPPLTWQTYDIEFTKAETDATGKKTKNAVLTVRHNGVVIHDKLELTGKTGGARPDPEGTPGPIKLQGHGNPLQYRNIWIVEKK